MINLIFNRITFYKIIKTHPICILLGGCRYSNTEQTLVRLPPTYSCIYISPEWYKVTAAAASRGGAQVRDTRVPLKLPPDKSIIRNVHVCQK